MMTCMRSRTRLVVVLVLATVAVVLMNFDVEWSKLARSPFTDEPDRVAVYEATIRYFADESSTGRRIYVNDRLCTLREGVPCEDWLSAEEIAELRGRLTDLPGIDFLSAEEETALLAADRDARHPVTIITLGPISHGHAGILVEAEMTCGGLCGGGAYYAVEPTDGGYTVIGVPPGGDVWIA
jgi:hypothetical protein